LTFARSNWIIPDPKSGTETPIHFPLLLTNLLGVQKNTMVGEVFAGLGAIKTALELVKGLKDIDDAARRNAAVIELQEKILAAQEAQTALLERISALKKEVADFETWNAEKEQYELKKLGGGALTYMLKRDARGTKPPHWVCAHCYGERRISIIQYTSIKKGAGNGYFCPARHNEIKPSQDVFDAGAATYRWLDD
jgi:hypothetical protein